MSLFNLPVPLKEKPVSHHPWEKIIEGEYTNYKYGHATAKNPVSYPVKKDKRPNSDQIKFTIIGNRLTEEFIFCTKLVNGLHKFRWKSFAAPVIQSVSSVEWPEKWRELKIRFGGLAHCLTSQVAVLMNDNFLGGEKELKELVESKYSYHIRPDYYKEGIKQFYNFIKSSGRPCVYMHISIDEDHIGTLIFMLYSDIAPRTCDNFLRLCTETKGGYSGTPVHRIVKDCWIQCGGFSLKSTDLDCENFIVPHDKRGVLGMANDGRHVDCSTQFFVLLQPAPWMASRYVAFGQLIDGEETLKKIEAVDTWWESPKKSITIYKSGLFNMDCHYWEINKMSKEYIQGHIENIALLGKLFYTLLLDKVFLTIELREIERMEKDLEAVEGEGIPEDNVELTQNNMRAAERFIRRKEEIEKQLQKTVMEAQQQAAAVASGPTTSHAQSVSDKSEPNKEFDVDEYHYEPEEYSYVQASSPIPSIVSTLPEIPYYIPLTDVPYPGEVDSIYNLKKMLKGDYCFQGDLDVKASKKWRRRSDAAFNSEVFELFRDDSDDVSNPSLNSEDEKAISKYIRENADRISFAGSVIKSIARAGAATDIFTSNQSGLLADGSRRKIKTPSGVQPSAMKKMFTISEEVKEHEIAHRDDEHDYHRHISISAPDDEKPVVKIKRRQTGYIRPEDLQKLYQPSEVFDADDDDDNDDDDDYYGDNDDDYKIKKVDEQRQRHISISVPDDERPGVKIKRRQTGFVRPKDLKKYTALEFDDDDDDNDDNDDDNNKYDDQRQRHISISVPDDERPGVKIKRRQTGFIRPEDLKKYTASEVFDDDDDDDDDDDNYNNGQYINKKYDDRRHISISVPVDDEKFGVKIKRRQTGFIKPEDLKKIYQTVSEVFDDDDDDDNDDDDDDNDNDDNYNNKEINDEQRKVRIVSQSQRPSGVRTKRRSTNDQGDELLTQPSALSRLFMDSQFNFKEEQGPTLKDYKPTSESGPKPSNYLTLTRIDDKMKRSNESIRDRLFRRRRTLQQTDDSIDHVNKILKLQHGAKVYRKQSTDYVKTIGRIEQKIEKSIRTIEFAKTRPCISVSEYQEKNLQYEELQKQISQHDTPRKSIRPDTVVKAKKPKGSPLDP